MARAAKKRGITSIVHFTRLAGLVGILDSSAVKSRRDLPTDLRVKHVYEANADRRLDQLWLDYVNLSVTHINMHMFRFSRREHPVEDYWVILNFSHEILGDPGVVFCTTNNIYPAAQRSRGLPGFEQLFAPKVAGRYGQQTERGTRPSNLTTDPQAEVLYPFELPLTHLHTVTVPDDNAEDAVEAALFHFSHTPKIELDPEAFR